MKLLDLMAEKIIEEVFIWTDERGKVHIICPWMIDDDDDRIVHTDRCKLQKR